MGHVMMTFDQFESLTWGHVKQSYPVIQSANVAKSYD